MTAFEVYMQEEYPNIVPGSGDYIHSWQMWRAALGWAKKQDEELCLEMPESAIGAIIEKELYEFIRDELGSE